MSIFWASLFITLLGNLAARETFTAQDEKYRSSEEREYNTINSEKFGYFQPFLGRNTVYKNNDYDDRSGGFGRQGASPQYRYPTALHPAKAPVKIYKPREDPRLFYQSDDYIKETNSQNVNYEVASIYPGREVVRFGDLAVWTPPARHLKSRGDDYPDDDFCVKCPRDKTLVAKAGLDKVTLQTPRLTMCSGLKAPKNVRFASLRGPKFGSLLEEGTYTILGRVMHLNKNLQTCKFKVHVVSQNCRTPRYLVAHCDSLGQPCNFTCRDSKHELSGPSSLTCGYDLQWDGNLPTCRVPHWCPRPSPPEHGRITCVGNQAGESLQGLSEGSRCRVRCAHGWHTNPRVVSICRRGSWNRVLTCKINKDNEIIV